MIKNNIKFGSVKKNISWILIQNIYTMLLGMVITGIIARHYGTEGYGIINLAYSFVTLFTFIAVFGTNHIILNDLTEKKHPTGIILGSNLFVRIILACVSVVLSQTIALFLYTKEMNIAIFLFGINIIFNCSDIIAYFAQSKMENKYISISKIISTTIFSILKIIVVILKLNIMYYIFTYLIENIIYGILLIISYKKIKKDEKISFSVNKTYIKELFKKSKYYALASLMVTIYMRIDQVMLGTIFLNKSVVGIYSAAVRISEIWTFAPLAVITSFKPVIYNSKNGSVNQYFKNYQKLFNVVSIICFIFTICIILFGKIGINILYGKKYIAAFIPLIILTIGTWFGVLGNIHYIWMTAENKEKFSLIYSFVGSIINIIFNIILIPKYGIIGAAVATLIGQISSNILIFLFIPNMRNLSKWLLQSLNPINGINELLRRKNDCRN